MVLDVHALQRFVDLPRLELTVFAPAVDRALLRERYTVLAACRNVCEFHRFELHVPVVGIGRNVFRSVVKHFNLHRVYSIFDDKPLVIALGYSQL